MTRTGKTEQVNISMPKELVAKLKAGAEKDKRSLSNFIALLLSEAVKEG